MICIKSFSRPVGEAELTEQQRGAEAYGEGLIIDLTPKSATCTEIQSA
jgi:hypothetical protein